MSIKKNKPHTPRNIRPPFGNYSHGVEVPAGSRLLFTSGQLGCRLQDGPAQDGSKEDAIPEDAGAQAEICFGNIAATLAAAGMDMSDIVRINAYVTDRAYFPAYMAVRDRHVGSPPPASTLVVVAGFTRPEFKVEVEVVAAKLSD